MHRCVVNTIINCVTDLLFIFIFALAIGDIIGVF